MRTSTNYLHRHRDPSCRLTLYCILSPFPNSRLEYYKKDVTCQTEPTQPIAQADKEDIACTEGYIHNQSQTFPFQIEFQSQKAAIGVDQRSITCYTDKDYGNPVFNLNLAQPNHVPHTIFNFALFCLKLWKLSPDPGLFLRVYMQRRQEEIPLGKKIQHQYP